MKVLIARPDKDRLTPFKRGRDFNFAEPFEILTLPAIVCEGPPEHAAHCGCDRSFSGIKSGKATTFGIVAEIDEDIVRAAVRDSEIVASWRSDDPDDDFDADEVFFDDIRSLESALADVPVGAEALIFSSPESYELTTNERQVKVK